MKLIQRFKCDYCQKTTARVDTMKRHETECIHNPNGKNCYMCELAYEGDTESYEAYYDFVYTIRDVPQCAYTEDILRRGDAKKCEKFVRSKELFKARSFDDASKNYEKYFAEVSE